MALIVQTKRFPTCRIALHCYCVLTSPQLTAVPASQTPRVSAPPRCLPSSSCHPVGTLHPRSWPTDALASGFLSFCDLIFPGSATPPHGHAPSRLLLTPGPPKSPRSHFLLADTPWAHSLRTSPPFTAPCTSLAPPWPASTPCPVITAPPPLPPLERIVRPQQSWPGYSCPSATPCSAPPPAACSLWPGPLRQPHTEAVSSAHPQKVPGPRRC